MLHSVCALRKKLKQCLKKKNLSCWCHGLCLSWKLQYSKFSFFGYIKSKGDYVRRGLILDIIQKFSIWLWQNWNIVKSIYSLSFSSFYIVFGSGKSQSESYDYWIHVLCCNQIYSLLKNYVCRVTSPQNVLVPHLSVRPPKSRYERPTYEIFHNICLAKKKQTAFCSFYLGKMLFSTHLITKRYVSD